MSTFLYERFFSGRDSASTKSDQGLAPQFRGANAAGEDSTARASARR